MDREEYEKDLRRRQAEHLKRVSQRGQMEWQPCMHESCPECVGTGVKTDGTACIHMISCPCPKCRPYFMMANKHPFPLTWLPGLDAESWIEAGLQPRSRT